MLLLFYKTKNSFYSLTWHLSEDMSMWSRPGGGGARKGSAIRGRGLTAPAPAPLEPAEDAALNGPASLMPPKLN